MNIEKIFTSYKTLIAFMILCIFIQMILGDGVLYGFLWLVLFSMLIINVDDFVSLLNRITKATKM